MTSPPHHSRNADATENLIAGFGSITVADRPFQSAPLPPDYHSLSSNEHHPAAHTPTQSRTPFSLPTSKEAVLYSSGQQPALGPAFTPVPTPHHGPLYPYGGRPPDLTSHIGSPQDVFYYHEESNSHQQPQNWANQSVAHKHRGELHHFVQSPTGSTNNVPFGSPHMFNTPEQLAIQHHHYQADNTHFQAVQSEAQAQWMGRQQGMYTGGERRQEAQPQYPFSQTPATRPLRQSIPNDYPPQSDYHVSPYLGHLAPATPDLPSFQPVHYPSGVHHPLSPNPLDFASHTPLSPMRTGHRHLTMDPHRPRWSQKLEDFRLNRVGRKWEFKDVWEHIVEFAGDQQGSRFIQQKIENCTNDERQRILDEILPTVYYLMSDVFGNYVIQKLFECGDQHQKAVLAKSMEKRVQQLSTQMYGCRSALAHSPPAENDKVIAELRPHILEFAKCSNANHVIQRLITLDPPDFVINAFIGHVGEVAVSPHGCRVLQKIFETLATERTRKLLDELHQSASTLIADQFGNYVVQSIIVNGISEDRSILLRQMKGHVLTLSCHKYASNVCEKAIIYGDEEDRFEIIEELIGRQADGTSNVAGLLSEQFGNFPLQTALVHGEPQQQAELLETIRPRLKAIRHTPIGKRLSARIAQLNSIPFVTPDVESQGVQQASASPSTAVTISPRPSVAGTPSTGVTSPDRHSAPPGPRPAQVLSPPSPCPNDDGKSLADILR